MDVDQSLTEEAVARADRAAGVVGRADVVESEQLFLEMSVLSQFMSRAADDGRRLDLPAVADVWIDELSAPGAIGDFTSSVADDPDIDEIGADRADRYAVTVAIAAVLSTPVRDELLTVFADSISLTNFEQWLRSGSTAADIVRSSLLQLPT